MKKFLCGVLIGIIVMISITALGANIIHNSYFNNEIKIEVDGKQVDTDIVTVELQGEQYGKNYVAARDLAEAMGGNVKWDGNNKKIIVATGQPTTSHKVVRIVDGDTFEIKGGQKVRMIGIDTPESVHPDAEKNTEFGKLASEFTKSKIEGKNIKLVKDVSETDKYGRLLRYVYLEDGTFFNELLVKEGYAKVSTYPPDVKFADVFVKAEQYARENDKGLWGITKTSQTSTSDTEAEYQYVGSKESNKYHLPTCTWAKKITAENLIKFKDKEDAEQQGYEPCGVCKP